MKSASFSYPDVSSVSRPVPHSEELPVPVFTHLPQVTAQSSEGDRSVLAEEEATTVHCFSVPNHPRPLNQFELNDLVRDLNLIKDCPEIFTSFLK